MKIRITGVATLIALGATSFAFAQSTTPSNSAMTPPNATSPQTPNGSMNDSSASMPSGGNDKVGQDPKMKSCMTSEKAKNTGQSDDQMKQKCMMQIGSHQGQGK